MKTLSMTKLLLLGVLGLQVACFAAEAKATDEQTSDIGMEFTDPSTVSETELHTAVRKGSLGNVDFLLNAGIIGVNATNYSHETALHLAVRHSNLAIVRRLLADPRTNGSAIGYDVWQRSVVGAPSLALIRQRLGKWNEIKIRLLS